MTKGIGTILKLARVAQGLTQQELAYISGVSQCIITKIETGRVKNSRPEIRLALARALNQPPEIFLTAGDLDKQKEKETLKSMLIRCGVNQKAASLIVDSIRGRSRPRVIQAIENRKRRQLIMNNHSRENGNNTVSEADLKEFLHCLATFVPSKSIDGAKYIIDYWGNYAGSSEFKEKSMAKWEKMDRLVKKVFDNPTLKPDAANLCICKEVPEAFKDFPIWSVKNIRVAGRDVTPSELFGDPFTCLLAWCGVLGIRNQNIVPGYLLNKNNDYVYEGLSGSLTNFGHLFIRPAWRSLVVAEIARQYHLDSITGEELLGKIRMPQDELDQMVYLLKKVMALILDMFGEQYGCMGTASSFYGQCLWSYNPGICEQQVRSITSGAVIPIEKHGGKLQGKHSARFDYFEKGMLGPGAEKIRIYYQWDRDRTAQALAEEQKRAEKEGRGAEHKQEAISILSKYLGRPNIELSEGSFSGPWHWKRYFTLVSDKRVAFSGRDDDLKKINHGLWVNHQYKDFLMTCVKELIQSQELTVEQKNLLQQGLPDAERLNDLTMLLYRVEDKCVWKPYGDIMANPKDYAKDIVEELLRRGKLLMR